jgi:hypothetical protein
MTLAGCAAPLTAGTPGPGVPRISELRVGPDRLIGRCAALLIVRVEDDEHDVVKTVVHVTHVRSGAHRLIEAAVKPDPRDGTSPEHVSASLIPDSYGSHWMYVQVEDAQGHRSNVLRKIVHVHSRWPWERRSSCP